MLSRLKGYVRNRVIKRQAKTLLRNAATLIREVGWAQGASVVTAHPGGPVIGYCATGAINTASVKMKWVAVAYGRAFDALDKATNRRGILDFNDALGRTKEEVLTLFKKAEKYV